MRAYVARVGVLALVAVLVSASVSSPQDLGLGVAGAAQGIGDALARIQAQRLAAAQLAEQRRRALAEEALWEKQLAIEREALRSAGGATGQTTVDAITALRGDILRLQESQLQLVKELRAELAQRDEIISTLIESIAPANAATSILALRHVVLCLTATRK